MHSEIDQTANMALVHFAYLSQDDETVVVELKTDSKADLPFENLLFFPLVNFTADKVRLAIFKLQTEYRHRKNHS